MDIRKTQALRDILKDKSLLISTAQRLMIIN